ncbi:MAG: heme A synthase [Lautropia sp.]
MAMMHDSAAVDRAATAATGAAGGQAKSATAFRRLLIVAIFLTFDLILFGSFVRVADAGLGCPDWPGCYGRVTPIGAIHEIRAEASANPDGPVTVFKAWVEMLHRYLATALGVLVIALLWLARRHPRASVPLAAFTLAWIILQGLFGMWTVTLKLQPVIVTAHLLGAMVLLGLLFAQANRIDPTPTTPVGASLNVGAGVLLAAIVLQIALGGWVSTNYAALACPDFPACQGSLWPDMDLRMGFELWRPLGKTGAGEPLTLQALTAIHYVHRLLAYLVLGGVFWLGWRLRALPSLRTPGNWLLAVGAAQLVTGLSNIFLEWPAVAQVLHTGGAAALFGLALMIKSRVHRRAGDAAGRATPAHG